MQDNQKYTTAENIMARLSMKHKTKDWRIEEVVQWCSECEIEILASPMNMARYVGVKLNIVNQKALLPCNLYRLYDVYVSGDNRIKEYYNDGTHLVFSSNQSFPTNESGGKYVYINYDGIPVDMETGYPQIMRGHELACEAYCVYNMYLEDYLTGKMNGQQWGYIDSQKTLHLSAANNGMRHHTNDDLKRMMNVVHNMLPRLHEIPLLHLDGVE